MSTALDKIIAYKRGEVAELKQARSFSSMDEAARAAPPPRGFAAAMDAIVAAGENALICELKRKSPSAGDILPGADPIEIAKEYENAGAACLSVLTDGPSFGGSLADFEAIRSAVSIPMLRKDFMIDPIQIAEARAYGADCILIILSALNDTEAAEMTACAIDYGMDALIETHDEDEVKRALKLPSSLIGINNRDLKRMVTDISTTARLAPLVSDGRTLVSESGISTPDDIKTLRKTGVRRFLIGESLMKQGDKRTTAAKALRTAV